MSLSGCKNPEQSSSLVLLPLIEKDQLDLISAMPHVKWVDLREPHRYLQGHIPGAIQLWRTDIEDPTHMIRGMCASTAQLQHTLRAKGINAGDHVVVYDDKGNVDAARLWWLLQLYGYPHVSLLNGGLPTWETLGLPIDQSTVQPLAGSIELGQAHTPLVASKQTVLSVLYNTNYKIIDARSAAEYRGTMLKKGAARAGRIPGSILFDYSQTLNENGMFRPYQEIRQLLLDQHITPGDSLIIYCHSGVRSAHVSFVLTAIMDYPYVANFDGSWLAWSCDPELPIENDSISYTMN